MDAPGAATAFGLVLVKLEPGLLANLVHSWVMQSPFHCSAHRGHTGPRCPRKRETEKQGSIEGRSREAQKTAKPINACYVGMDCTWFLSDSSQYSCFRPHPRWTISFYSLSRRQLNIQKARLGLTQLSHASRRSDQGYSGFLASGQREWDRLSDDHVHRRRRVGGRNGRRPGVHCF